MAHPDDEFRYFDWGALETLAPPTPIPGGLIAPHKVYAGPGSGISSALPTFRYLVPEDMPFAAILDNPNVFTRENTIRGLRIGTRTVTADYTITATDFEILVDATTAPITITLPAALGTGQIFRIKKIDGTNNSVVITPQPTDLMDNQSIIVISDQYLDCTVLDADIGYWDHFLSSGGILPTDIARLGTANIFTDLNTFTGVRFATITVDTDYTVTEFDYEILVNATDGPITITLPPSTGAGQFFHVKKVDVTANLVTIAADGTDLIDASSSLVLFGLWADASLLDGAPGYWDNMGGAEDVPDPDLARLSVANIFTEVNTFTGVRIATRTIVADDTLTDQDYEILADATGAAITVTLPPATGSGQIYRVKKIDPSVNIVTVAVDGADLIDGASSLVFTDQWAGCLIIDAAAGYWDNTGGGGGTGTADFGANGRVRDLFPIHGFAFDVLDVDDTTWVEQVRYTEPTSSPAPVTSVTWWYKPEIQNTTDLAAFPTLGNQEFSRMDVLFDADPALGSGFKIFILKSGAADGGDPGQVAPDDYDVGTNDFHWESAI